MESLMRIAAAVTLSCLAACASAPVEPAKPKGPLAMSEDNPLRVEKMSDEVDYMQAQRCGTAGHWQMGEQKVLPTPQTPEATGCMLDKFAVTCSQTGERAAFYFLQCL
jgi:hypothetical protein